MRRTEVGLACLLVALFFLIVAGGHVTLDTSSFGGAPFGILLTLAAAVAGVFGLLLLHRKNPGAVLLAVSFGIVYLDFLAGGDQFVFVRVLAVLAVFGGLAFVLGSQRVVQTPTIVYTGCMVLLVTSMAGSVLISEFKWVSLDGLLYWLLYAAAFYLTVAVIGRVRGPRLVVETVVLSGSLVALNGLAEYLSVRANEPTHRIFADWNNPNALAGLFVAVIPLALALACTSLGAKRVAGWIGGGICVAALVLTQSKGGLLVAPIGVVVFFLLAWGWSGRRGLALSAVPLVIGAVILFGVQSTTPKTKSATAPLQRVSATAAQTESSQSLTYRRLLWKGAVGLFMKQPVGYGVGTYRFYSAQSGLNEQTQLTHQSYLQIAVEGGALAALAVLALAIAWTVRMFKGARALSSERNVLRAGVTAAVVAIAANGFIESNIYYLATGLLLFVLLGTGLQLAADGTTPESIPAYVRGFGVLVGCLAPIGLGVWILRGEYAKADVVTALDARDLTAAEAAIAALGPFAGIDDDAAYMVARLSRGDQADSLEKAAKLGPRTRTLRALAEAYERRGDTDKALIALGRALTYDPNNLRTLSLKMQVEDAAGRTLEALATASAIIAVEDTPYLQVRALPEYVPTEPSEAREFIAKHTKDKAEEAQLLRAALDRYVRYRATTVPQVMAFGQLGYNGDRIEDARAKMQRASTIADRLIVLYRESGDAGAASEVGGMKAGLALD